MTQFAHMHRDENYLDSKLRMPILHSDLRSKIEKSEQDIKRYSSMTSEEKLKVVWLNIKKLKKNIKKN
jgi:hypothetical protein